MSLPDFKMKILGWLASQSPSVLMQWPHLKFYFFSILAEILWKSDKTSKLLLPGKIKNSINKVSYEKNADCLLSMKCVLH